MQSGQRVSYCLLPHAAVQASVKTSNLAVPAACKLVKCTLCLTGECRGQDREAGDTQPCLAGWFTTDDISLLLHKGRTWVPPS